jgi:dihydrolipoamide dehydrogenase
MTDTETYDLIILGGGMAGLPMAFKSAHAGLHTALIEARDLGGTCLNRGCIPTKTMIRSAEVAQLARRSTEFGVEIDGEVSVDMTAIRERKNRVINEIQTGTYENAAQAENLDLIEGHGEFTSSTEIAVDDRSVTAETIVVNTGARPLVPPIDGIDEVETLDSTSMLELDKVPDHLLVIGGGYVGSEYAQMFARFGAEVTIVQRDERLIPREEPDASATIEEVFTDEGITVRTDTAIEALANSGEGITATPSGDGADVTASAVLIAAGRQPNTDDLGLAETNVDVDDQGFIDTTGAFETADANIYAMGDVTGPPMFTHSARDDADRLYRQLVHDEAVTVTDRVVPHAIFTDPQVGRAGMTEAAATDAGYEVATGRAAYASQGKPKALGEPEGFVKIVADAETGELLGAHVVGEQGADIVHELSVAMTLGGTAADIANAIHVHPTLPEVIMSAADNVPRSA